MTSVYEEIIADDKSLAIFLKKLKQFDTAFCDNMVAMSDFTIRLEVRGNKGELLHARVYCDDIERPKGVEKKINQKT